MVGFALYVQRFFEPIRALVMQFAMMQRAMTAGMRIFELLDVKPELVDAPNAMDLPPMYRRGLELSSIFQLECLLDRSRAQVGAMVAG